MSSDGTKFFFIDKDAKLLSNGRYLQLMIFQQHQLQEIQDILLVHWANLRSLTFSPDGYKMFIGDAKE